MLGEAEEDAIIVVQSRYRLQMEQYARFSRQMGLLQEMQRVYGEKLVSSK